MGAEPVSALTTPVAGAEQRIESSIARHLAKHGLLVAPVVVGALALTMGADAAYAAVLALAIVIANFLVNAAVLGWAARVSTAVLMGVALGGYVVRLAAITGLAVAVRELTGVDFTVFCVVLIAAHLGLLVWELRSVSLSLAAPGLRGKEI
ncbi:MAG: hypothetical protein KatS3mg009_1338 [Acidimicrobiia bacterium]|nr:MAG: hypothetical protein KatS3mg009_1338 [Acidimicrobiia bacterium]